MSVAAPPEYALTSTEVCRRTGLTYRRLDYWTRSGAIPRGLCTTELPGSGHPRRWTESAARALAAAAYVSDAFSRSGGAGGMELRTIRKVIEASLLGRHSVSIAPGVVVIWPESVGEP